MNDAPLKLMIVAGEASGDAHAARLISELKKAVGGRDVEFFGSAGPRMRSAGVDAVVEADELSIVGLAEIGRALPMFIKAMRKLRSAAAERRPDAAILVDFPDFNLRLARHLSRAGIKVIYYISPQLWAWRKYRVSVIRKYVDLMIAILPFEKDWYAAHGVEHVKYVGNPLAREVHALRTRDEFCADHQLDPKRTVVSLLPGSRQSEISRILPVMLDAAAILRARDPAIQYIIPLADARHLTAVSAEMERSLIVARVVIGETYDTLAASDAAAVTSGTATLEAGILGTPMVIVYTISAISYHLLEPLTDVPHRGLINLIAGERLATELIQSDLTPERLSSELLGILDPDQNADIRVKLKLAAAKLGQGGASKRAADLILDQLEVPRV